MKLNKTFGFLVDNADKMNSSNDNGCASSTSQAQCRVPGTGLYANLAPDITFVLSWNISIHN